jgi:hypothetical protein
VSGRQKPDFQRNSATIDKNDRVGSPLVRNFEGAALFRFPFVGEVEALASMAQALAWVHLECA